MVIKKMDNIDNKIADIVKQKRDLYMLEDAGKITADQFTEHMNKLQAQHAELNKAKINMMNQNVVQRTEQVEQRRHDIITKVSANDKRKVMSGKRPSKNSCATLLIKSLMHPLIDNEEKVVCLVHKWKPNMHKEDIRKLLRQTICNIKSGNGRRYKGYTWDKDNYMLHKKQQSSLVSNNGQ